MNPILAQAVLPLPYLLVVLYLVTAIPLTLLASIILIVISEFRRRDSLPMQYVSCAVFVISVFNVLVVIFWLYFTKNTVRVNFTDAFVAMLLIATSIFSLIAYRRFD